MDLVFAHSARADVQEILAFYHAPSASAGEFGVLIQAAGKHLSQFPYTGHRRRDLEQISAITYLTHIP